MLADTDISPNHMTRKPELHNFELHDWGRHSSSKNSQVHCALGVSIVLVSSLLLSDQFLHVKLRQNATLRPFDFTTAHTRGLFGVRVGKVVLCFSTSSSPHMSLCTSIKRTAAPLSRASRTSTLSTMPLRAKITSSAWATGTRKVYQLSYPKYVPSV